MGKCSNFSALEAKHCILPHLRLRRELSLVCTCALSLYIYMYVYNGIALFLINKVMNKCFTIQQNLFYFPNLSLFVVKSRHKHGLDPGGEEETY